MLKSTFVTLALSLLVVDSVAADQSWQSSLWKGSYGGYPYYSKTCVVPHKDGQDDSPEIVKVFQQCNKNAQIVFKEGVDYNMWSPMSWVNLSGVTISLNGNLHLPNNITAVQQKVATNPNPPSNYAIPWIYIQGSNVYLKGSSSKKGGAFHGYGQQWWDIGNRTLRPQLATFNVTKGWISKIKVIKPVAWGFNIPGVNITITDHFVDAAPGNSTRDSTISFPFNTDGFNMAGQNIVLDGYYGHNGDDCVSVVNGARNILAKNGYCGFSSHGLSIGSLGRNGANHTVKNVLFKDWTMEGAVYGARFKSWTGGRGLAENVTWQNIKVVNVSTPIFVTQNYYDQDKGPRPNNTEGTSTHLNNILFDNFSGTIGPNPTDGTCISNPCWNYVQGADGTQAIIFDLFNNTALNLQATRVKTKPIKGSYSDTTVICDPSTLAPGEQNTLGFQCQRGPFVTTPITA
ncbi:Probable exopolygalacturonase C; AltName: Full=Galacturan 1,4-alpha-galacturonidase C; AltName: Full=Poly(1,4-alpha-D-galacturonide)galacturonohydrolase C; Flags: Precursor [Serendipita indica DSM 11827]|uniref:galacturonan 1,4-alpha-galacturonidase n=1 Tax=Serendipita indica (strain DSM 11827) TaxID=1109443 RepID=G4TKC9_SERID|nr:Probable exopolygalacturonase C; AltName: Full=Galacturan 1,4-alpha-galacturonidase C; AltName: Full=Poly(1,4-alpha-D-galacturonide)galacturonohydrolase C; Flags: Precursor [Serendipita indica DSM 11827]CCA71772.1 probable endopolygalacturonase [Serendipita indica DSM 11827]